MAIPSTNSVNWIGIDLYISGEKIDLHEVEILDFQRCLDMQKGLLSKNITFKTPKGATLLFVGHQRTRRHTLQTLFC